MPKKIDQKTVSRAVIMVAEGGNFRQVALKFQSKSIPAILKACGTVGKSCVYKFMQNTLQFIPSNTMKMTRQERKNHLDRYLNKQQQHTLCKIPCSAKKK